MGGLLYCIISDIIQKKRHRVEEIGLTGMIFMVASALSYGFFSTGIDNAAHIGGLVGGFLITMISRFVFNSIKIQPKTAQEENRYPIFVTLVAAV